MRSRRPSAFTWLLPLLLLLPPAGNFLWEFYQRRARAHERGPDGASIPAIEAAVLRRVFDDQERQLEWEREREDQRLRRWSQLFTRYTPLGADVVRLSDLSPRRNSFWVWADNLTGVGARTAVVHGDLEAMVGMVKGVWPDRGIAPIQTIWDPYFRVRFRYRESWGFLFGSREVDAAGRPLLEIRHLGAEVAFTEGDTVCTDGDDGFYPGGIPIGTLFRQAATEKNGGQFMVRGLFGMNQVSRVMLLVDRAGFEVRTRSTKGKEEVKNIPAAALLLFAIAFQGLALPLYRAGGTAPDFPFLALAYLALFAPARSFLPHAVACACLIDLAYLDPIGTRLAGYLPALWLLNLARRSFIAESGLFRALLTFVACLLAGLLSGAWLAFREGVWLGVWFEVRGAAYTALIGVGVRAVLDHYRGRLGWVRDRYFVT